MISGTLTLADAVAANRLHRKRGARRQACWTLLIGLTGALVAALIGFWFVSCVLLAFGTSGLVGEWLVSRYLLPRQCARLLEQNPLLRGVMSYSWDDGAVTQRGDAGSATLLWRDLLQVREDERLFLLYLTDNQFQPVPKAWFGDPAQIDEFRRLASQTRRGLLR